MLMHFYSGHRHDYTHKKHIKKIKKINAYGGRIIKYTKPIMKMLQTLYRQA